mgnify:CR=1 FL=1
MPPLTLLARSGLGSNAVYAVGAVLVMGQAVLAWRHIKKNDDDTATAAGAVVIADSPNGNGSSC